MSSVVVFCKRLLVGLQASLQSICNLSNLWPYLMKLFYRVFLLVFALLLMLRGFAKVYCLLLVSRVCALSFKLVAPNRVFTFATVLLWHLGILSKVS